MGRITLIFLLGITSLILAQEQGLLNPPAPEFEVEDSNGIKHKGLLRTPLIRIITSTGAVEVKSTALKRISPHSSEESHSAKDTVEIVDHQTIRGKIETPSLELLVNDQRITFAMNQFREAKSLVKKELGFWGIVLGLLTLTIMEIILGIDNVIFLAIIAGKLPLHQQPRARRLGLILALGTRLLLLFSLSFLLGLTKPILTLPEFNFLEDLEAREISLRDLILLGGGVFLIFKSVREIHEKVEHANHPPEKVSQVAATFGGVLLQIAILDVVFSLDSVITAVGMVNQLWVMVVAMLISMGVMLIFAGPISDFVAKRPTVKVLALAFLILIGVMLVAESLGQHLDKGYIYFAMSFAVVVEFINLKVGRKNLIAMN